ncbi:MAG: DPP IV N-terminal domain-containing protein, partial [Myxococcaceae bacterium]
MIFPALALAETPVIEISGANFRPMPVAAAAPLVQDEGARARAAEFDEALSFDLAASGLFQMLDRKSFLSDAKEGITAGSISFSNWANVGAEALVKTQLASDGERLKADLRLFTVSTGREELKISHEAPVRDARRLAHRLANEIYRFFTRETGPFETHLVLGRKTAQGKDVYLTDWDGKNPVVIASGGLNVLPALGPDGTVGYTSYRKGKPDIFGQRPGGQASVLVQAGRMATGVAFSPDGKRIAYSLADGESAQLWIASADGSSPRQLTKTPFFINSSPTWSPDGKRLAFVSTRGGTPQIYLVGADGGDPKRLTFQGNYNQTPDWSPRGDLIVFTARDERNAFDLFTVGVDTGKVKRLTQDVGNNEEPSFSPNGRHIVFTSNRNGGSQPFVMTFEGNAQTALP